MVFHWFLLWSIIDSPIISIFVHAGTAHVFYKCEVILSVFQGEHSCHPLRVDQCQHSEVANMDIPELHCKSGGPVNDYVSPENIPFVFAQTPKGYYNQPLQKCTPPPLILATPTVPSQSGLPSSPIRGLFPNPSYNLMMQAGDQWSNPGPELQEGTCLERNSSGYQPQSRTENFTLNQTEQDPECYILLPQ